MKPKKMRIAMSKKAVILVVTLWMTVVLTLIAYSLTYELQLEVKLTKMRKDSANALAVARAGAAKAIVDLKNDLLFEYAEKDMKRQFDAEGDVWKRPEEGKIDQTMGKDKEAKYGFYNVEVIDEESKINLNNASQQVLKAAVMLFGYEDEESADIAFAIIDWRDPDDKPSSGQGEKEGDLYAELQADRDGITYTKDDLQPIRMKNDLFTTVEELLDVPGMTPELFYGKEATKTKSGKYKPYSKTKQKYLLQSKERFTKQRRSDVKKEFLNSDEKEIGFRDLFTVNSSGIVNVNTASKWVLAAIIGGASENVDDAMKIAEEVVDYRRNNKKEDIDNDKAFTNVGELSMVGEVAGLANKMNGIQPLNVMSDNFLIHSIGECGYAKKSLYILVNRSWEVYNLEDAKIKEKLEKRKTDLKTFRNIKEDESKKNTSVYEPTVRILHWMEK